MKIWRLYQRAKQIWRIATHTKKEITVNRCAKRMITKLELCWETTRPGKFVGEDTERAIVRIRLTGVHVQFFSFGVTITSITIWTLLILYAVIVSNPVMFYKRRHSSASFRISFNLVIRNSEKSRADNGYSRRNTF